MNRRFSLREFAFLCAPIAIVAVVALVAARRPKPVPPKLVRPKPVPLHLEFAVEKPTILEAFQGANSVLVTRVAGDGVAKITMDSAKTNAVMERRNAGKKEIASTRSWITTSPWAKVWKGQYYAQNGLRLPANALAIPPGEIALNFTTQIAPLNAPTPATSYPLLRETWPIDRSKFAPFDFKKLAREPQIRVRSIKILTVSASWIEGETTFELLGEDANAQTPVDFSLSGLVPFKGSVTSAGSDSKATTPPNAANLRVVKWNLVGHTPTPPTQIGDLHGRISAGERWPLAFQIEPIDFSKVKAGQNLKWTEWPAPLPK